MFQELYTLYRTRNQSDRVPLEDFNTEAFSGILNMHGEVLVAFADFLGLPEGTYRVSTQGFYSHELSNCYVDMVLEAEDVVCFIENKVGSSEGYEQLNRYVQVLKRDYPNHKKYMVYCTKDSDPKDQLGKDDSYHFRQVRWYEIAKELLAYKAQLPLVNDYLKFLDKHKMTQDNTIRVENLLTIENLQKTVEIMLFYIEQSVNDFQSMFGTDSGNHNFNWHQLKQHNRFSVQSTNVLESASNKPSEILYSVEFEHTKLNVQLFLGTGHEKAGRFKELAKTRDFEYWESEWGSALCLTQDLGIYLNNEQADKLVKSWFAESFKKFREFILDTPDMNWKENFVERLKA